MNYAQMKKVRKIIAKVQRMPRHLEIGGWVEKEYVYIFVRLSISRSPGRMRAAFLRLIAWAMSRHIIITRPWNCGTMP